VLLYELLAGNPPFDPAELLASGLDAMRRAIREREPVRPSTRFSTLKGEELTATAKRRSVESAKLLHQIKGDLDWIVMKCLEKDRTRRYETATGLALDLKRHLDSEPVLARPPTAAYKLQKAIRRNKTLFAAAALVVLALAAGLGLAAVGWQQTKLERDRALQAQAREAVERRRAQASEQAAKSAEAGQAGLRLQAEAQALTARRRAYAADMNLAQQALAINNIGRAKVLLDQQRPEPGQTDLRGWEWRFLWNQIRPDDHEILFAGTNRINHPLSFSADGQLLVREFAGEAVVTDVKSHQIVWQQTNAWWPVFTHHGLTLAYASRVSATNSSITLEDLGTHKQDRLSMPWATTEWIGFTADDRRMILVSDQGNCLVTAYDFDRKSSVWSRLISFPTYNWRPYAISPDGQSFAGVTPGGGVVVMDMQNGNVRFAIKAADDNSTAVAFSPDSSILLTGGGFTESMIRLWDAHGGKRLDSLEGHHSYICDLLFTADGKTLISSSGDETIRLWDWTRRKPAGILRGHHDEVDGLALAADGQTLASRCKDGSVYLWDLGKPSIHLGYSMLPNRMTLENTIFTPDSRFILGLEEAGGLAEWDVTSGQETRRWWPSTTNHSFVALSRDGKQIACLESDGRLHVLDVSSDSEVTNMSLPAGVSPLMFTANGHYFVNLLENASRRELEPWKTDNWEKANPIAIARDGDPNYGETSLPDSVFVITGHAFHIFDVAQPTQPPKIIGNEGALCGYASSPDGQTTACCYEQGQIRLWNMATLKPIDTLKGFLLGAHSVTFSPDGRRLAAGSNGQEAVKLWDAQTRQEVLTLGGEGSMFMSLQFSPDGRHLMGINAARHAHIWYAPSWEEIAAAEAVERPGNGP
jgi:WD40 repeat protein